MWIDFRLSFYRLRLYLLNSSWVLTIAGFLSGVIAGGFIGWVVGRLLFPASSGQIFLVRAGRAALPLTLRATMVPAVLAGVGLSIVISLFFGAPLWPLAVLSGTVIAVTVGLLFGLSSALM